MEDTRTICDTEQKEKPKEAPKAKGEGWKLVDKFAGPLREYERFSVFQFIMIAFFLLVGFVLGWISCMLGQKVACWGLYP